MPRRDATRQINDLVAITDGPPLTTRIKVGFSLSSVSSWNRDREAGSRAWNWFSQKPSEQRSINLSIDSGDKRRRTHRETTSHRGIYHILTISLWFPSARKLNRTTASRTLSGTQLEEKGTSALRFEMERTRDIADDTRHGVLSVELARNLERSFEFSQRISVCVRQPSCFTINGIIIDDDVTRSSTFVGEKDNARRVVSSPNQCWPITLSYGITIVLADNGFRISLILGVPFPYNTARIVRQF